MQRLDLVADDDRRRHSHLLHDLCGLLLALLLTSSSTASRRMPTQRVTPAGLLSMLLGTSLGMMLCGSLTFLVGFLMMPWMIGIVLVLYVAGVVSTLSALARAMLCPGSSSSCSKDNVSGSLFSKLQLIEMGSGN